MADEISSNVPTTDANGFASPTDAFATLPASDISTWQNYVDAFRSLSNGAVQSVYPVYAPNTNVKDAEGVTIQAWTMGGPGPNPFASSSFFADVREMALYGGGISVDALPNNSSTTSLWRKRPRAARISGHRRGRGRLGQFGRHPQHLDHFAEHLRRRLQCAVAAVGAHAGNQCHRQPADIPSEYVVENYGTTTSIETNNAIGSETDPNTQLGVALWLAGYEQGRNGDLQLSAAANGSTHLKISSQTGTSLGGTNTTVSLATKALATSSYTVTLDNTSSNSSDWYIPELLAQQTGASADWSVQVLLNGDDITSDLFGSGGFTFNATSIVSNAGLVMNNGDDATLTFNFTPLIFSRRERSLFARSDRFCPSGRERRVCFDRFRGIGP